MRSTSQFLRLAPLAVAAGLLCAGDLTATPARAEVIYPWCIIYGGSDGDGGTNCGFVSRAQCMATASPNIGYCYENPMYLPPTPGQRRSRYQRRY
ncbi:MAG: DUF3551 domain-containing protein [Xanthobacteraceae bacterium]|nr:MAG: DUF3551 domain-containing protein [Xanthobacteraceae bacterium]